MELVNAVQGLLKNMALYAWSFPDRWIRIANAHIDKKFNELWDFIS